MQNFDTMTLAELEMKNQSGILVILQTPQQKFQIEKNLKFTRFLKTNF